MNNNVSYRDILRCRANNMNQSQIAKACSCARSTVQDILKLADEKNIGWGKVENLTEKEVYELIRGRPKDQSECFSDIDFDYIYKEMSKDRTMTLSLLWEEYAALALRKKEKPYGYSRFCELYGRWCDTQDLSITRRYIAGNLGEFDWAGQKMQVIVEETGEIIDAHLFVACLPFSQMVFVKAYPCETIEMWCLACSEAFSFYGGSPRLLTIDNLRTGITTHTTEEIVINRTYREFAEHYNVAVIPHAPRSPRGKSSVESSVGKFANKIRNMLRNETFESFDELNSSIQEKLEILNSKKMQKRLVARKAVFEEMERPALQPLPNHPFELVHWSTPVRVPKTYHIQHIQDKVYYSVPYYYVGKKVEMRWSATMVEIYCDRERIASHVRDKSKAPGESVTNPSHRSKSHNDFLNHDSEWFRDEAKKIGESTYAVIESFLNEGIAEEQGWGWCEKLLRKKDSAGKELVEDACAMALKVTKHPSYKVVNALIRNRVRERRQGQTSQSNTDYALYRFKRENNNA